MVLTRGNRGFENKQSSIVDVSGAKIPLTSLHFLEEYSASNAKLALCFPWTPLM